MFHKLVTGWAEPGKSHQLFEEGNHQTLFSGPIKGKGKKSKIRFRFDPRFDKRKRNRQTPKVKANKKKSNHQTPKVKSDKKKSNHQTPKVKANKTLMHVTFFLHFRSLCLAQVQMCQP